MKLFPKKNKEIIFLSEDITIDYLTPIPSAREMPEWYKATPPVDKEEHDLTIKKCVPVLDAFNLGYVFRTSVDIHYDEKLDRFTDNGVSSSVTMHPDFQIKDLDIDPALNRHPYKWVNKFFLKTPKGYSTLFVHPLNRTDLPFQSISAIVDTDDFPLSVQFPFFMKKGFSGVIPAGTPIIQAIPVKRDDWRMNIPEQSESYYAKELWSWFNPPMAMYKRKYWKRKMYK